MYSRLRVPRPDICLCSQKVISNKSWTSYGTCPWSLTWLSPYTKLLSTQVKARLGGRLRLIISGGAALSTEVEEFLRVTCCAFFVQGYGKETLYVHKHGLVSLIAFKHISSLKIPFRHNMLNEFPPCRFCFIV